MLYGLLADLVVLLHLAFVFFAVLGRLLLLKWPRSAWLHVPAVVWAALIEFKGWVCPLTPLENWLRHKRGETGYQSSFVEHYLLALLYPTILTSNSHATLADRPGSPGLRYQSGSLLVGAASRGENRGMICYAVAPVFGLGRCFWVRKASDILVCRHRKATTVGNLLPRDNDRLYRKRFIVTRWTEEHDLRRNLWINAHSLSSLNMTANSRRAYDTATAG